MKFVHEFRTIAGLTSGIIDVTDETVKYLEKDGATGELLSVLAEQKEKLQAILSITLEIAEKDIDAETCKILKMTNLTSISEILDDYCKTVNSALQSIELEHKEDIMYFLAMSDRQSQTIKNKIDLNSAPEN